MRPASALGYLAFATVVGLIAAQSVAQADEVAVGDHRLGIRTAPILLLTRHDVQADLKLSIQQITEARETISTLRSRAVTAKEESQRRQIEHEMTQWLKAHLSQEQFNRLHQIDLQWEGISAAVSRPIVAEYLGLTDQQKASLRAVVNNQFKARGAQPPTIDAHAISTGQGLKTLTQAQQKQWQQMIGAPCVFTITAMAPQATPLTEPSTATASSTAGASAGSGDATRIR